MHTVILLLAWRYIRTTHAEKNISLMIKICFIGIFIASCALALILSIMHGIERATHEKLRSVHPDIILRAYGDELNIEHLKTVLTQEFPAIKATSPTTIQQLIMHSAATQDLTNVVTVKAIDPIAEQLVTAVRTKITNPSHNPSLPSLLHGNHILIGSSLAALLEVKPGDPVILLCTNQEEYRGNAITFAQKEAIIGGIFTTGIDEFDGALMICSLDFLNQLWPDIGVTQLNIALNNRADEPTVVAALRKRLPIEVFSWKDLYPGLVSALLIEKYAMTCIVFLIMVVALINIISVAFMHIQQKRGDIAILKAMGMSNTQLKKLFMLVSISVSSISAACGLITAFIIGTLLQRYPCITLPDAYYIHYLPITMEWYFFAGIFIVVLVLSCIATLLPLHALKTITLARILKSEA